MPSIVPVIMLIINFGYPNGMRFTTVSVPENSVQECRDIGNNLISKETNHRIQNKWLENSEYPAAMSYECVPAYKIDNTPTTIEKPLRG